MQLAAYPSGPTTPSATPARWIHRIRLSPALAALVAVGAALALSFLADPPGSTNPAQHHHPLPMVTPATDLIQPISDPIDWNKVDATPDAGPLAVAAY
ncbi:MAG: hypothetical protein ABIV63_14230 [Caldimonas sp.]